jgi:hypothetical protein
MKFLPDMDMSPSSCPYCETPLNKVSGVSDADLNPIQQGPAPGDITVCLFCSQYLVFDDNMGLRRPHAGELDAQFAAHPKSKIVLEVVAAAARKIDRRGMKS